MNQSICQVGMQDIAPLIFAIPMVAILWTIAGCGIYLLIKIARDS